MRTLGLAVTNQSFSSPDVRLVARVDDEVVLDERFEVANQHTVRRHIVDVPQDARWLTVVAPDEGYENRIRVDGEGSQWVLVSYWERDGDPPIALSIHASEPAIE